MTKAYIASKIFGVTIGEDSDSRLFKMLDDGNTVELTEEEMNTVNNEFILEEIALKFEDTKSAIALFLDGEAQKFGFDSILSARSYSGFDNKFQDISLSLAKWSADCWAYADEQKDKIVDSGLDISNIDDIINLLPSLEDYL